MQNMKPVPSAGKPSSLRAWQWLHAWFPALCFRYIFSNLSPGTVWYMPAVKFALHRSLFQGIYRMRNLEQETSLLISSCTKIHWKMSSKFKGSSFSKTKKAFLSVFSKWKLTEEDINPIFPSINSGLLAFFPLFYCYRLQVNESVAATPATQSSTHALYTLLLITYFSSTWAQVLRVSL